MSDVHCAVCGEPWDSYGITHGDMLWWEARLFRQGAGCPCCEGEGGSPDAEEQHLRDRVIDVALDDDVDPVGDVTSQRPAWERPEDVALWECAGCGVKLLWSSDYKPPAEGKALERVRQAVAEEAELQGDWRLASLTDSAKLGTLPLIWARGSKAEPDSYLPRMSRDDGRGGVQCYCDNCCESCEDCGDLLIDVEGEEPEGVYDQDDMTWRCLDCHETHRQEEHAEAVTDALERAAARYDTDLPDEATTGDAILDFADTVEWYPEEPAPKDSVIEVEMRRRGWLPDTEERDDEP